MEIDDCNRASRQDAPAQLDSAMEQKIRDERFAWMKEQIDSSWLRTAKPAATTVAPRVSGHPD